MQNITLQCKKFLNDGVYSYISYCNNYSIRRAGAKGLLWKYFHAVFSHGSRATMKTANDREYEVLILKRGQFLS